MNREDVAMDLTVQNVEILRNRVAELEHPEQAEGAQGEREESSVTILPDGSAFGVLSFPLPTDHWLYAEREYDGDSIEPKELPAPILNHAEHREAVVSAARYAVRSATMCGKESDFDPDALVQNMVYAMCGPFGGASLAQPSPAPELDDEYVPEGIVEAALNDSQVDAVGLAAAALAPELERPEVVATVKTMGFGRLYAEGFGEPINRLKAGDELMTVAQHDRIVGVLRRQVSALALGAEQAMEQRNAALEKVAELEGQSGIEFVYDSDELVAVPRGLLGAACHAIDKKRDAPRTIAKLREYARGLPAPVAQAGQVPEELTAKINECLTLAFEEIALYVSPDKCRDPRSRARRASALATEIRAALAAAPAQGE